MSPSTLLGNGEEYAARSPDTFKIPSRSDRENLAVGDHAKLIFQLPEPGSDGLNGERMWVRVTQVFASGCGYAGTLANAPTLLPANLGDPVKFGPEHIIDIIRTDA